MEPAAAADPSVSTPTPTPTPTPERGLRPFLAPDTVLDGTYRIVRLLGEGGMGEVYLAAHERLPGFFAVKALQTSFIGQAEAVSRFRREAEILAGVRHPNVVQVVDFNVTPEGVPYLVMELADGPDLARELSEGRELSPADAMSIVRQIGSALDAAHAVGVVHRDLKPANVILMPAAGQAPVVKVIDFGISISDWSAQITTESRVMGTPEFMSPEQALGRRDEIDARSDQFALAALAYNLLAKRPPFEGDSPLATLSAIVHGEPGPLAPHVSWPAHEVEQVLRKGMARARDDRFGSVLELVEALDAALARSGALAEPARACPSASVALAGSRSDPALARLLSERRTPGSGGSHPDATATAATAATAATVVSAPASEAGTAATAATPPAPRAVEERITRLPVPGRARSRNRWLSVLALLILGGGALWARTARPLEAQRAVALADDVALQTWTGISSLMHRLPPVYDHLRRALGL